LKHKTVTTAVSAFDSHYPHLDRPTWSAVLDFVRRNPVDLFVFGGDNLDCGAISHHNKNKPIFRPRGQMKRDLEGFRRTMLDPIEALLPPNCQKVWLTGNHEDWAAQLIEEQPELEGLLDFPEYLQLSERGWIVKPQGGHFKRGHLKWLHGDVLTGGANAPRKALDVFIESVMFGHFHTGATATKVLPHNNRYKWQAWAMGCLGKVNPSYMKNRPSGWLNQFGVTEFYGRGYFNHYPVTVLNGQFAYGGMHYGGR
jgi:hypothetical protein